MSMDPIIGNSLSNTCPETISSNCIAWAGGNVNGLCQGASLTQVLQQVITATTPVTSCYTGNWVDFSSSIPLAGSGTGFTWTIGSFGVPFGVTSASLTGPENSPQYKWTRDGNLSVRGSFLFTITPTVASGFIQIQLATIAAFCFPTGFNASQSAIIGIDAYTCGNSVGSIGRAFLTIDFPTKALYLNASYLDLCLGALTIGIFMGSTTFNLA